MEPEVQQFKTFIEDAQRILVTSHLSPDPDAIASLLLLGTTLQLNYPDRQVKMALEEEPSGLDFLNSYQEIAFGPVWQTAEEIKPDLIVIVDTNIYKRVSREGDRLKQFIESSGAKTIMIDHHEPEGKDETDLFINQGSISAAQEVYELLFDQMRLKKPEGYAQTTMTGIYSDSGGFAYANARNRQTFKLANELLEAGVNIEDVKNRISQYTDDQIKVIAQLANNLKSDGDHSYTYLTDDFINRWADTGKSLSDLNAATKPFIDSYIRNIGGRQWGFIVYKDKLAGDSIYSVSLRAVGGTKAVSVIAQRLGGGGHKAAAAAKFQAKDIDEAIKKVKDVIAGAVTGT